MMVVMTAALYRHISEVGRLSVVMLAVVLLTVGWVIVAGLFTFSPAQAFDFPPEAYRLDRDLLAKIGAVSLLAMYNYGGYNNVCNIGEEIRDPHRTIPRAIVLSILLVVTLYVLMSTVILGMIPWQVAKDSPVIASVFIERTFTDPAAGKDTCRYWIVAVDALGQEGIPSAPAWHLRQWRKYYEPFVGPWHQ